MTIDLFSQGARILTITPDDTSYRYRKIGGEDRILLTFSAPKLINFAVGVTISFQGRTYTLYSPATITKINDRNWQYALTLDAPQELLRKWRMKHRTDGAVKFHLTAKPSEHLRMLVDCANAAEPKAKVRWSVGTCIEAPEKLITYNHTDLLSALSSIAKVFETEWEIEGKEIRIGKVEYYKDNPLHLSYGKGNGLRSGVKRENDSNASRLSRLYVQGSDRNIEHAKYGAKTLLLPKGISIHFDGDRFKGEKGYNEAKAHSYKVSEDGLYVERIDDQQPTGNEGSIEATDIYPSRIGEVTSVTEDGKETKTKYALYSIYDTSIPESLDYEKALIPNQPLQVIFQSGILAGITFDAHYYHDASSGKQARRLALVPKEEDGVIMPSPTHLPKVGDKYAVFNVNLPQSYIREDKTKTGAEWVLLRRALKSLYQSSLETYVYRADLDGLWTKKDWLNRGGRIRLGAYVKLSDKELIPEGVDIRIVGIKEFLNAPESPEIELSNNAVGASIRSTLEKLKDDAVRGDDKDKELHREAQRTLQRAMEASEQISRAIGERFGRDISPVAVRTMQLIAGDESLQFRFIDIKGDPMTWSPDYAPDTHILQLPEASLEHLTLGQGRTISSKPVRSFLRWYIPPLSSPPLINADDSYYLYALCEEGTGIADYYISRDPIPMNDNEHNRIALLIGILSRADQNGDRSFTRLYGFTEILPGRITTEKIATPDGSSYFDLTNGTIASRNIRFVYPDGSEHPYPNDYLHKAITEGTTEIQGGLVLGSIIGAKDSEGVVRSFLSGDMGRPAFSAGVTNFGTSKHKAITELNHDGTGHIGSMHIGHGGKVITFEPEVSGGTAVRIGGGQTPLGQMLSEVEQNLERRVNFGTKMDEIRVPNSGEVEREELVFSERISVDNDGSSIEISLPVQVNINTRIAESLRIVGKASVSVEVSNNDQVMDTHLWDLIDEQRSGAGYVNNVDTTYRYTTSSIKRGVVVVRYHVKLWTNRESGRYTQNMFYSSLRYEIRGGAMTYKLMGVNPDVREVVFSSRGMSLFFGRRKVLYVNNEGGDNSPFLTVRGRVDMPGILLSGECLASGNYNGWQGSVGNVFGSRAPRDGSVKFERVEKGLYRITHNMGLENYIVILTPMYRDGYNTNTLVSIRNDWKNKNEFGVSVAIWGNREDYVPFSFLLIGNNYED